jgi:hypothetical protein
MPSSSTVILCVHVCGLERAASTMIVPAVYYMYSTHTYIYMLHTIYIGGVCVATHCAIYMFHLFLPTIMNTVYMLLHYVILLVKNKFFLQRRAHALHWKVLISYENSRYGATMFIENAIFIYI